MANHKSAKKRARQTEVRTIRNKVVTTRARNLIKKLRLAITEKNKDVATDLLPKTQASISMLAKSGIIKANTSARKVSRLTKQVSAI